eukprot:jgi/Chrpa1/16405/Chrysochromulina_OHIO_Genome00005193-RA
MVSSSTALAPLCCSRVRPWLCACSPTDRAWLVPPRRPAPTVLRLASHRREDSAADDELSTFRVHTVADVLRLIARALWLGAVMLPPLLLLLPAYLLPEFFQRRLELEMLRALQRGGPCTIKLGQWASTRPDVLPLSVCRTLATLHDTVPAHSVEHTRATIEAAFGAPLTKLFAHVDPVPVGSGCIAQVHCGATAAGERVAIKVLHPGVIRQVALDVYLMRTAAKLVEDWLPVRGLRWLALSDSADEFAAFMASQLDLRREATNLARFRANFGSERGGAIQFPRPFLDEGLVARSVLVESFVNGTPLSQMLERHRGDLRPEMGQLGLGIARDRELARRGLEAFFTMVLRHNFVHADLHPGNVLVMAPDDPSAPLGISFVDAGLAVELSARDQANFKRLFRALGAGDGRKAARLMLEHSPEHACEDPTAFEEGVQRIVQGVGLGSRGAFNLKALKIGDVLLELTTLVRVHRVKVEPNFTTLVTAIVVLEGLGRQLDPTLDLFAVALPLLL